MADSDLFCFAGLKVRIKLLGCKMSHFAYKKIDIFLNDLGNVILFKHVGKIAAEKNTLEAIYPVADVYRAMKGLVTYIGTGELQISAEYLQDLTAHASSVTLGAEDAPLIHISKSANSLLIKIRVDVLPDTLLTMYLNDYKDILDVDDGYLHIDTSRNIPMRKIRRLIRSVTYPA